MPVFGTTMFGSGGAGPGTVSEAGNFASGTDTDTWSFSSVDLGTGGKLVVAFAAGYRSSQTLSNWTAAGTEINTLTTATNSENIIYIGTVDVGANTSGTIAINLSASINRCMGFVWDVANVDLFNPDANPTADKSGNLTFGTIAANGLAVACGYDQDAGITGSSGLDYDGETSVIESAAAAGASKAFGAAQSDLAFSFSGSLHADGSGSAGLALPSARDLTTTYRYWRFSIAVGHNADEVAVGEVKIFVGATQYPTAMTGDSAPSPLVATGSSRDNATRTYYRAFDRDVTSTDSHWASQYQAGYPQYVQVDLGSGNGIAATSYSITAGKDGKESAGPKTFSLQGSNDGSSFTTVDTQTNVGTWSEALERTYTIS
jgi:hypothetical protein